MAKLTAEQFKIASRARFGLTPRPPRSVVPSITRRDYAYVLLRWERFAAWKAWRDTGGPKPAGVWTWVPEWDGWTPWQLLKEIRHRWPLNAPPTPVPAPKPPGFSTAWGQSWFVIAQAYREAWSGPDYFGRAFTADHSYEHPTREEVAVYRARGIRTAVWGDSRPPTMQGTSPQQIVEVANDLRVDRPMFQAELLEEYKAATKMIDQLGGDGHPLIANISEIQSDSVLFTDFSRRVKTGNVLAISECYKNCGWGDPNWANLPCASTLGATYSDGGCAGMGQEEYYSHNWLSAHRDSWYTAGWESAAYAKAR